MHKTALFFAGILTVATCVDGYSFRVSPHRFTFISLATAKSTPANELPIDTKERLLEYLSKRTQSNSGETEELEEKQGYNFFSMFKPAGMYVDRAEMDLAKRSDKRIPEIRHPLSFIELKRFGYEDISPKIVELGGPYIVGDMIGLNWTEPERKKLWDERLRPRREEFYALDFSGSLLLGSALEDRLALAEELDLQELKANMTMSEDEEESSPGGTKTTFWQRKNSKTKTAYSRSFSRYSASTEERDRFTLRPSQRVYLSTFSLFSAVGWGRASQDLLLNSGSEAGAILHEIVDLAQLLSAAMAVASIGSAIFSASMSTSKGRERGVWLAKSLLGGPLSLLELRSLPAKEATALASSTPPQDSNI